MIVQGLVNAYHGGIRLTPGVEVKVSDDLAAMLIARGYARPVTTDNLVEAGDKVIAELDAAAGTVLPEPEEVEEDDEEDEEDDWNEVPPKVTGYE